MMRLVFFSMFMFCCVQLQAFSFFSDYSKKNPEEVVKLLQQKQVDSPNDPHINYNLGVALYKTGDYEFAKTNFKRALNYGKSPVGLRKRCYFNLAGSNYKRCLKLLGNGWEERDVDQKILSKAIIEARDAVENYNNVLVLDKDDTAAKDNKKIAEQLLQKLQQKSVNQDQKQKKDNQEQKQCGCGQNDKDKQHDKEKGQQGNQEKKQNKNQQDDQQSQVDKKQQGQQDSSGARKDKQKDNRNQGKDNNSQERNDKWRGSKHEGGGQSKKQEQQNVGDGQQQGGKKERKSQDSAQQSSNDGGDGEKKEQRFANDQRDDDKGRGEERSSEEKSVARGIGKQNKGQEEDSLTKRQARAVLDNLEQHEADLQKQLIYRNIHGRQQRHMTSQKPW